MGARRGRYFPLERGLRPNFLNFSFFLKRIGLSIGIFIRKSSEMLNTTPVSFGISSINEDRSYPRTPGQRESKMRALRGMRKMTYFSQNDAECKLCEECVLLVQMRPCRVRGAR